MVKEITLIDGTKVTPGYYTDGNHWGHGIQNSNSQVEHGLNKGGFLALRHKESGEILIPEMKKDWASGNTISWWDSKSNAKLESSSWLWNTSYDWLGKMIEKHLDKRFSSKITDYELILFSLKENVDSIYYAWWGVDDSGTGIHKSNKPVSTHAYYGPCPLDREHVQNIDKVVVLSSSFNTIMKKKIVEKQYVTEEGIVEV